VRNIALLALLEYTSISNQQQRGILEQADISEKRRRAMRHGRISLKKIAAGLVIVVMLSLGIARAVFGALRRYLTAWDDAYERKIERREAEARARGAEAARRAAEMRAAGISEISEPRRSGPPELSPELVR
jgi:hypothetical protein